MAGIRFDLASGKRIARSVRKTEQEFRDLTGKKRPPGQILNASQTHWGTLDAALAYDDTVGVAVSLDIGGTIENVLPPPVMISGTIDKDDPVLIELIDGDLLEIVVTVAGSVGTQATGLCVTAFVYEATA